MAYRLKPWLKSFKPRIIAFKYWLTGLRRLTGLKVRISKASTVLKFVSLGASRLNGWLTTV